MKKIFVKQPKIILDVTHPDYKPKFLCTPLRYNKGPLFHYFNVISGTRGMVPNYLLEILSPELSLGPYIANRFLYQEHYKESAFLSTRGSEEQENRMGRMHKAKEFLSIYRKNCKSLAAGNDFIEVFDVGMLLYDLQGNCFHYHNEKVIFEFIQKRIHRSVLEEKRETTIFISDNPDTITFVKGIRENYLGLHIIPPREVEVEKMEEEKLEIPPKPTEENSMIDSKKGIRVA